jgi:hypothetical protein
MPSIGIGFLKKAGGSAKKKVGDDKKHLDSEDPQARESASAKEHCDLTLRFRQTISTLTLATALNNNGYSTLLAPVGEQEYNGPLDLRQSIDSLVANAVAAVSRRSFEVVAATTRRPNPRSRKRSRSVTVLVSEDVGGSKEVDAEGPDVKGSMDEIQLEDEPSSLQCLTPFEFGVSSHLTSIQNSYGNDEPLFKSKEGAYATIVPEGTSCWGNIRSSENVFSML